MLIRAQPLETMTAVNDEWESGPKRRSWSASQKWNKIFKCASDVERGFSFETMCLLTSTVYIRKEQHYSIFARGVSIH